MFDLLISFFIGLIIYVTAFKAGYNRRKMETIEILESIAEGSLEGEEPEVDNNILATVEKHGEIFYLFSSEDDTFLAQGRTWDEIKKVLGDTYGGDKEIVVNTKHAKEIGLL